MHYCLKNATDNEMKLIFNDTKCFSTPQKGRLHKLEHLIFGKSLLLCFLYSTNKGTKAKKLRNTILVSQPLRLFHYLMRRETDIYVFLVAPALLKHAWFTTSVICFVQLLCEHLQASAGLSASLLWKCCALAANLTLALHLGTHNASKGTDPLAAL